MQPRSSMTGSSEQLILEMQLCPLLCLFFGACLGILHALHSLSFPVHSTLGRCRGHLWDWRARMTVRNGGIRFVHRRRRMRLRGRRAGLGLRSDDWRQASGSFSLLCFGSPPLPVLGGRLLPMEKGAANGQLLAAQEGQGSSSPAKLHS